MSDLKGLSGLDARAWRKTLCSSIHRDSDDLCKSNAVIPGGNIRTTNVEASAMADC